MNNNHVRVYVAGPYSSGNMAANVRNAVAAGHRLLTLGFAPLVPHLTHFFDLMHEHPYEDWLQMDLAWVTVAEAVLRLPGVSAGADRETALALQLGIPVFTSIEAIVKAFRVSHAD